MATYRLIKIDPLTLVGKNIHGHPVTRTLDDLTNVTAPEGYKYIVDEPIPNVLPEPGNIWVRELTDSAYSWVQAADSEPALKTPVLEATKLTIMRNLLSIDRWELFEAALTTLDPISQKAWELSLSIREDDPVLLQYKEPLKQAIGIDESMFKELFNNK